MSRKKNFREKTPYEMAQEDDWIDYICEECRSEHAHDDDRPACATCDFTRIRNKKEVIE